MRLAFAALVDVGLEPRSVGLAVDDEVEGVVLESVDGALGQESVEGGNPLGGVAIAGHYGREARIALGEELVDVPALLPAHGLQREIIDEEHVDGGELVITASRELCMRLCLSKRRSASARRSRT
jgi:hypothetical protein